MGLVVQPDISSDISLPMPDDDAALQSLVQESDLRAEGSTPQPHSWSLNQEQKHCQTPALPNLQPTPEMPAMQNLVQEGGVKAAAVNLRPTPARSAAPGVSMQGGGLPIRSQTLPSKELLVALDELHQVPRSPAKDEAQRPSALQTIESGKPFIPSNDWPTE